MRERQRERERERERERQILEFLGELQIFGFAQARDSGWFSGTKLYKIV